MNLTDQERADYADLIERPQFQDLSCADSIGGIYEATANGSAERTFFANGRRSLGLDILRIVEAAQPLPAPAHIPTLTLIQVPRGSTIPSSERTKSGRRNDPYADLRADAEPGAE
jgi:hypothetical protein